MKQMLLNAYVSVCLSDSLEVYYVIHSRCWKQGTVCSLSSSKKHSTFSRQFALYRHLQEEAEVLLTI